MMLYKIEVIFHDFEDRLDRSHTRQEELVSCEMKEVFLRLAFQRIETHVSTETLASKTQIP